MSATDFTFIMSVSTQPFPLKPTASEVGRITFEERYLTISDFEILEKAGYSFCYLFQHRGKLLTMKEKTEDNFIATSTIFYDIDKMSIPMEEFVSSLQYEPSFAYTSYSNGIEQPYWKYGYRLVYLFSEEIMTKENFNKLYNAIAVANNLSSATYSDGTKFGLDYRGVSQQYYGGGGSSTMIKSNRIYSISDFGDYITNFEPHCEYFPFKDKDKERRHTSCSQMETEFEKDLKSLSRQDFLTKYRTKYYRRYVNSLSTKLNISEDGTYYEYPEDFMTVEKFRKRRNVDGKVIILRWKDGEGRRKKLYLTAQIMKHNLPDIRLEELIYFLMEECHAFYVGKDGCLNKAELIKIAKKAFVYSCDNMRPISHPSFKVNKEYWIAQGYSANQAKQIIRRERKEKEVLDFYDFNKSVKENMEILNSHGVKVGKSYLYKFRQRYSDRKKLLNTNA